MYLPSKTGLALIFGFEYGLSLVVGMDEYQIEDAATRVSHEEHLPLSSVGHKVPLLYFVASMHSPIYKCWTFPSNDIFNLLCLVHGALSYGLIVSPSYYGVPPLERHGR